MRRYEFLSISSAPGLDEFVRNDRSGNRNGYCPHV